MPIEQPRGLIAVLLDRTAEFGDRDDAAMDLGDYDEQAAFDALLAVATDHSEDADLHDRCGESLATICLRNTNIDYTSLPPLCPAAQRVFAARVQTDSE